MYAADRARIVVVDRPGSVQAELLVAAPGPDRRTPMGWAAYPVLSFLVGGSPSARVDAVLREALRSAARRGKERPPHRELEQRISAFLGTDDTILYSSCFDANGGVFEVLFGEGDAIISDELNHASIIDGIRLSKAARYRYRNADLADLEVQLKASAGAHRRVVVTDGVFSMDGSYAPLPGICELARRYDALVLVDDSHAIGFVGATGGGTPEMFGVQDQVDIVTGTLGKALGGASGGYVSGHQEVVDLLQGGQGVFGIAVSGAMRELTGAIADFPGERADGGESTVAAAGRVITRLRDLLRQQRLRQVHQRPGPSPVGRVRTR